ncbi:MAG: threonylcarbamoyl-AMP synthase [Gammaproteobacteria bacterium]|nr:threonylcarbamoyl-AMP synthase [Gammaproteobacteria bacterium]MBU0787340.1 threonylcarbamoyl-AMP synthase [Gammaproteobacteria bacterium]MBU0816080.1 threonylcarbamoyl-AMP synthase [Gammaproteobacteria bacterium]MBU1787619.1 threonylcarbamoyl-AMP synthase [Gammaproteobacteria bacterium]
MILDGQDAAAIAAAAQALHEGELVGLPTETVYGLGADAASDSAVAKIFAAKGRPSDHPLIVHVADAAGVDHFAQDVPTFAQQLMQAFWPGPLTLILPRRPDVGAAAAGGQASIGLRCPAHPVAHALLLAARALGVHGVAAPSANQFGRVSPTTAAHVQGEFGEDLLILDGGACEVGIESTIIDCTRGAPVLLRPGAITREQVQAACGLKPLSRDEMAALTVSAPRASGTLEAHYAPKAKVRLMGARALQAALDLLGKGMDAIDAADKAAPTIAVYSRAILQTASTKVLRRRMPDDAAATAQQLFAVLREFDKAGVKLIWIETPPDTPEWEGVRDRLQRAAAS